MTAFHPLRALAGHRRYRLGHFVSRHRIDADEDEDRDHDRNDRDERETSYVLRKSRQKTPHMESLSSQKRDQYRDHY